MHPDDAELVADCFRGIGAGKDRERITYRVRHRAGHWLWVDVSLKLIRDPDSGAPREIHGSACDVTARMESVAALRRSEERFRLLLRSSAITEAIYLLDPDGNVENWSVAAEQMKGYAEAEIIGRNFAVFFTPEDIANGEPARSLAEAVANGSFTTEAWRVRKDGSRFLARMVIDAVRGDDGRLRGFIKATRDITNQRIEEEQREIIIEAARRA